MSYVKAVATALPQYRVTQSVLQQLARQLFTESFKDIDRLLKVFRSANISERYFAAPPEWYLEDHSFSEKNRLFLETAVSLASEAVRHVLSKAQLKPADIDHLIVITSSGLATPSLGAYLVNKLNLDPHIKRTPIWGLGCAGGAVGLARAHEYVRGAPGSRAVVVAVELCSLTFRLKDRSKSNLVATALFGDGAAAVLVDSEPGGLEIQQCQSTTWKDTLDVMGWDFHDDGWQVIFSRSIPSIVENKMHANVSEFLTQSGLTVADLTHYIVHPGGSKVLQAFEKALNLEEGRLAIEREVLEQYGNMSSVTVLFVLQKFLQCVPRSSQPGLIAALGPGFSSELLLFSW